MKKIIIIISIIAVICAIGVGAFFVFKNLEPDNPLISESGDVVEKEPGLADKAVVKPITIKESASGANRMIDVKYPSIHSFANKDFQNFINTKITDVIFAYKDEILVMVDDKTPETALYSYTASYDKYTHGDYLSLVISNDYQTGGIRSTNWKDIHNIDVRSERIFYIEDIFPANVNYKEEILDEIEKQAKENNYVLMNGEGLTELDDKQKFYIKDGKLIIYFDPSEIAPNKYGELQFEMPFSFNEETGKFNP